MRRLCVLSLVLSLTPPAVTGGELRLPEIEPVKPERCGKIDFKPIAEPSGLVRSRLWPEVLWTHNDSGGEATLFAIERNGEILSPGSAKGYRGIDVLDAVNIDWEDIATDDQGNLFIGAFGNNDSVRRDLAIYIVREPNPYHIQRTRTLSKIDFTYPNQESFPAKKNRYDAEALFHARGKLYVLTKQREDWRTRLFRLDRQKLGVVNELQHIGSFDIGGRVTGPDSTADGRKIAVLTHHAIWLFESRDGSDAYFDGAISWLPLAIEQGEGVAFYDDDLIIVSENKKLFCLSLRRLQIIRE